MCIFSNYRHTIVPPKSLKIGFWNINGLRHKIDDIDFIDVVQNYDILALGETWLTPEDNPQVEGYYCYSSCRNKQSVSKFYSGGIAFLIKEEIRHAVKVIDYSSDFMVWVKLDKKVLNLKNDVFLSALYIPPSNSSFYNKRELDPFDELENAIQKYSTMGEVILAGDINARTGCLPDYIENDNSKHLPTHDLDIFEPDMEMGRQNMDQFTNSFGKKLLNICQNYTLRILNGRTLGDLQGNFTCKKYNGKSTVDYILSTPKLIKNVRYFKVLNDSDLIDSELSDHYPLMVSFKFSVNPPAVEESEMTDIPPGFKWTKESDEKFKTALSHPDMKKKLSELKTSHMMNKIDIDEYCKLVTNAIVNAAQSSLKKRKPIKRNKRVKRKWVDNDCKKLYKEILLLKKLIREGNTNPFLIGRYCKIKKRYRKLVKQNNKKATASLMKKIESIEQIDPQAFWKAVNNWKESRKGDIEVDTKDLFMHLNRLANKRTSNFDNKFSNKLLNKLNAQKSSKIVVSFLDKAITEKEIERAIKSLKNGKSSAQDNILNEMLKSGRVQLVPVFLHFFNTILKLEQVPKSWNEGWITPIFKSGLKSDPKNYRPITVTSCLGKLFTKILNTRLTNFLQNHNIISEFQIGFKENCRTSDHILVLKTIIDYYKNRKKHIYACFVDFSNAFPSVWRNGLYYKLLRSGISSKFVNLVIGLYTGTTNYIKIGNKISKEFTSNIGLRQGCNLSPTLFNIFTNDLPQMLLHSQMDPISISGEKIPILMYADDIIILSQSEKGLQIALNHLSAYCFKWKLIININKTKIIVFNSRNCKNKTFMINGKKVEIVDNYTYLGIVFTPSGKFKKSIDVLITKANKAWHKIWCKFNIWNGTPPNLLLKLFTSFVQPVLLYGAEIWGSFMCRKSEKLKLSDIIYNPKNQCEKFHIKICKQILGIGPKSSNISALLELGRFPISIKILKLIYRYISRVLNMDSISLVWHSLKTQQQFTKQSSVNSYMKLIEFINKNIKTQFCISQQAISKGKIANESNKFERKLQDMFKNSFPSIIGENRKLVIYKSIKTIFRFEPYLKILTDVNSRVAMYRFRASCHNFPIETGRYKNVPQSERVCSKCNLNEIGSEEHMLFRCSHPLILDSRKILFDKIKIFCPQFINLPQQCQMQYLLSCSDKDIILVCGKFLQNCLNLYRN